ncbi:short-chain dehydrogenase [Rhodococcus sp. 06-462-5]|uniref:SDR family NAD(P)-dependent oxidoreductase n=1 Tax=Nocardiaceae TaxID=85025 RepID=UPI00050C5AD3|nr:MULTISPECIES: SDR family NAD(P)-dependent oxidoreductase [Rhodococcus]OZC73976.1 short-chain dehydrogenase [Rhodococcus sp. 06-462-5]OZE67972.1 short-chain dehydrogenase [Rhodococcus sp. 02-925g]OZF52007.1 short-chain dehydrogenase [Rhodococcus sp. 14-1411-2a]
MKKYDVAGRTVVITGAAGGLGQMLADALRARHANVALLDLDADAVTAQAERLGGTRVARGWRVDVRDLGSLETAMREVEEHFGRIDVVIAGAGIGNVAGPLTATDPTAFERVVDINLLGVWRTFRAAAPYVQERRGHLMAVASMASFVHAPLHGSYTSSKAGVWALCDSLRLEFRHLGVTVGSVHPSFFKTPLVDEALAQKDAVRLFDNFEGAFQLIPPENVVKDILLGIERRSAQVVTPRTMRSAALAPGLIRLLVDRFGFSDTTIAGAIELSLQRIEESPLRTAALQPHNEYSKSR